MKLVTMNGQVPKAFIRRAIAESRYNLGMLGNLYWDALEEKNPKLLIQLRRERKLFQHCKEMEEMALEELTAIEEHFKTQIKPLGENPTEEEKAKYQQEYDWRMRAAMEIVRDDLYHSVPVSHTEE